VCLNQRRSKEHILGRGAFVEEEGGGEKQSGKFLRTNSENSYVEFEKINQYQRVT